MDGQVGKLVVGALPMEEAMKNEDKVTLLHGTTDKF